jgi:signal transduction histidine kinase
MRLIYKIVILYLLITLGVIIAGGIITYVNIQTQVNLEQKRHLREQLGYLKNSIEKGVPIESLNHEKVSITRVPQGVGEERIEFTDTVVIHATLRRLEPHVKLKTITEVSGTFYRFEMYDVIVEAEDIIEGVYKSMLGIYAILFVAVIIITFIFSARVFKPFNKTLEFISGFSLSKSDPLDLRKTSTREFTQLNEFISEMTRKVKMDYQSLKEFTENASHEMQTPLAIMNSKLQLLIDSPNLNDNELKQILSAQEALTKLGRLGHSLALLTKIENQEFNKLEEVNMSALVEKTLDDFTELIEIKGLTLSKNIDGNVKVHSDQVLMDVIIANLLQNAIKHNIEKGKIRVSLNAESLTIENTGNVPKKDPALFFERFRKEDQSGDSLGLGLAIVQKICEANNFQISYNYTDNKHVLTVKF